MMASASVPRASRDSLERFLKPRSVALIGATERSVWTRAALANFTQLGYSGSVHLVNRNGDTVLGRRAAASAAALGEEVDLALLMVPAEHTLAAFDDLHAAGIGNAIVLSSGFAEAGAAGGVAQQRLRASAQALGITLLGPNCLGFVNLAASTPVWTIPVRQPVLRGNIAVVSQSGATAGLVTLCAQNAGIGYSYLVSTGNEAGLDVAAIVDFLVDDVDTRVIAVFIESVRDPQRFCAAADRAKAARKPIIVLKVGASEATVRTAQAHTGALVGDDRVFDAACRKLGLLRVHSIEDLIFTAATLDKLGPLPRGTIAFASLSGGICEIAADSAENVGVVLPPLSGDTAAILSAALPSYAMPANPLDVTGAAMLEPQLYARAATALAKDPAFDAVVVAYDVPTRESDDGKLARDIIGGLADAARDSGKPILMLSHVQRTVTELSRQILAESGIAYLPAGIQHGMSALAAAARWALHLAEVAPAGAAVAAECARPRSEHETLAYLAARGVSTIPVVLARTRAQAVAAAASDAAVVLKIASADIAHKTEAGGIALNLRGAQAVGAGYDAMLARVRAARPDAALDGVLVAPMREGGVELFVGIVRDAQWGLVLAIGLGGIWVEALDDVSQRLLPVGESEVAQMLGELRGARLLDGFRGAPAVDRAQLARQIVAIGEAALALGTDLAALEVNPLLACGKHIEVLDALAVWNDA